MKSFKIKKDAQNAKKIFMSLKPKQFSKKDFKTGSMLVFKYDAKYKEMKYDKNPCAIILWRNKYHTLGLNLHWIPLPMRSVIIKYIFKLNKKNIKDGKSLEISYKHLKPFLKKINALRVIRLYINIRISRKGLRVPDELMIAASKYSNADFSVPAPEKLFKLKK